MTVNFPRRRDDQSFSVAASFSVSDAAIIPVMQTYVDAWARANQTWVRIWRSNVIEVEELYFQSEFLSAPRLQRSAGDSKLLVIFECKPSATRWKDWVTYFVDGFCHVFPESKFERFE